MPSRAISASGASANYASALLTALAFMVVLVGVPRDAPSADWIYRLNAGDSVRVSVFDRADLSGIYRLSESGEISFPLLGAVPAAGKSAVEIERSILSALDSVLEGEVMVNVAVDEYQPVYVDGDVMTPAAYPYRPGMTVEMVVAMAGGRYSVRSSGVSSLLGQTQEQERFEVLLDEYWADVAREARLVAEGDGLKAVTFPSDLLEKRDDLRVAEILINERELFVLRVKNFDEKVANLEERKSRFEEEIKELNGQKRSIDEKRRLFERRFKDIRQLADKGAMPRLQVLQLEISALTLEQEARAAIVSTIRARQGIGQVEAALIQLRNGRKSELASSLQAVQDRLSRSRIQLDLSMERLALLKTAAPTRAAQASEGVQTLFGIVRREAEAIRTLEVDRNTEVRPGDVIRVPFPEFTLPEAFGGPLPRRVQKSPD